MKIALVTIATGKVYQEYAQQMFNSARKFFPKHDQFVFTDNVESMTITWGDQSRGAFKTEDLGYPRATLMRYHQIIRGAWRFKEYDQMFYCDADMEFVAPVGNIFSDGLVATLHPGFVGTKGSPETRITSTAYCRDNLAYYCGGFQGGDARTYLDAATQMAFNIDQDEKNGVMAVWHDESHWNKYLSDNCPGKVLTPSYCFPEDSNIPYKPILVALDKRKRGNHPRYK
ncbi:Glycosyltransferase family 6 [uncultured archaeon]|nr:Glycosyltransferase family 6 [uncultured archaeon]